MDARTMKIQSNLQLEAACLKVHFTVET